LLQATLHPRATGINTSDDSAGPLSAADSGRSAVDVQTAVADESAERYSLRLGQIDREARRGADRDEDRASGHRRLLNELEREAAADAEDRVAHREQAFAESPAE